MTKLWNDLRTGALGIAGGIFTSAAFLLCEYVNAYYRYLSHIHSEDDFCHSGVLNGLVWIPITFWHIVLFVTAAFVGHRYLAGPKKSLFLLWQEIGGMALMGWVLTLFAATALEYITNPSPYVLARAIDVFLGGDALRFASGIFAGGVVYGSLIQSAAKHYMNRELTPSDFQDSLDEGNQRRALLWRARNALRS